MAVDLCDLRCLDYRYVVIAVDHVKLAYTISATGVLALAFVLKSPHHTNSLFAGLVPSKGWLSEREADIYVARIIRKDPKKGQAATMKVKLQDM